MTTSGWIGVDLDGTLAEYHGWNGGLIGEPIPKMVERVKDWLNQGIEVRIFTARVSMNGAYSLESHERADKEFATEQLQQIRNWCIKHIGEPLAVTCTKDFAMIELWDDRCVQVILNTGLTKSEYDAKNRQL